MAKVAGALANRPREAMGEEVALVNPLRRKGGAVLGPVRLSVKTGRYGASLSSLKFPEVPTPSCLGSGSPVGAPMVIPT